MNLRREKFCLGRKRKHKYHKITTPVQAPRNQFTITREGTFSVNINHKINTDF